MEGQGLRGRACPREGGRAHLHRLPARRQPNRDHPCPERREGSAAKASTWRQSAVSRILAQPLYTGKLRNDDGELVEGQHEAIISEDVWARVAEIRNNAHRRKGRPIRGTHLLVKGVLRCGVCGSAMTPRNAAGRGLAAASYQCSGRLEHGAEFCTQTSVNRARVDEPFLAALLDSYVDIEATRKRIAEGWSQSSETPDRP